MDPDFTLLRGIGTAMFQEGLTGHLLGILCCVAERPGITGAELTDFGIATKSANSVEPLVSRDMVRKGDPKTAVANGRPYTSNTYFPTKHGLATLRRIARAGKDALQKETATPT